MNEPDQVDWHKVAVLSALGTLVGGVGPWLLGLAARRKFAEDHRARYRWTDKNRWE